MRNNEIYQQLEQLALTGNYTVDQAKNLTFDQAANLLGRSDFSFAFFNNMKSRIIAVLLDLDDQEDFADIKEKVRTWLDAKFPNWTAERRRVGDKQSITIWLEGPP